MRYLYHVLLNGASLRPIRRSNLDQLLAGVVARGVVALQRLNRIKPNLADQAKPVIHSAAGAPLVALLRLCMHVVFHESHVRRAADRSVVPGVRPAWMRPRPAADALLLVDFERGLAVATEKLHFTHGGFETPLPKGVESATIIRAFNVLRQYDESEVAAAWQLMQSRLSSDGLLIEGTCDEIGRLSSWVTLSSTEPLWFTISLRLNGLEQPSKVAERLPKALIHHNVPGERIHDWLSAIDRAWAKNSPLSPTTQGYPTPPARARRTFST